MNSKKITKDDLSDRYTLEGIYEHSILEEQIEDKRCLEEGLIRTMDLYNFCQHLLNKFRNYKLQVFNADTNRLAVYSDMPVNDIPDLLTFINNAGYFISDTMKESDGLYGAVIEPKYPHKVDVSDTLYHICRVVDLESIKKNGLTPRESQTVFFHPGNRIYAIDTTTPVDDAYKLVLQIDKRSRDRAEIKNKALSLNKIRRVQMLSTNYALLSFRVTDYKYFYADPNTKVSNDKYVFTLSNIHPNVISIYGFFKHIEDERVFDFIGMGNRNLKSFTGDELKGLYESY